MKRLSIAILMVLVFASVAHASWRPPSGPATLIPEDHNPPEEIVVVDDEGSPYRYFIDPDKNVIVQEVVREGADDYWISQFQGSDGRVYRIVYWLKDLGWPPMIEFKRTVEVKLSDGTWQELVPLRMHGEWRSHP